MGKTQTMESNQPTAGEFFILQPDARRGGKGHGLVFENEEALLTPPRLILRPKARGFPHCEKFRVWSTTQRKACVRKT